MDQDNSNIPLLAHSQDCPTGRHENEKATSPIKPNEMWSFNLTRQSECAQALATANHGAPSRTKFILGSVESIILLSTSLLLLLMPFY